MPMYYEDVDLCFDARERGLRVMYEPESVVVHHEGATAGTDIAAGPKRHQEENRLKFVEKWRERLDADHFPHDVERVRAAARRHTGPNVLIVDFRVPMPDRDAGSLRMLHLLQTLRSRGCDVTLMPDNFSSVQPYTRDLQRAGIEVLYGPIDIIEELHELGADLALAILSRPHQASRWLDVLREAAPHAQIVYDTVDLHWLREARRANPASVGESIALSPRAAALRELELAMVRASDVTLVVSERERGAGPRRRARRRRSGHPDGPRGLGRRPGAGHALRDRVRRRLRAHAEHQRRRRTGQGHHAARLEPTPRRLR